MDLFLFRASWVNVFFHKKTNLLVEGHGNYGTGAFIPFLPCATEFPTSALPSRSSLAPMYLHNFSFAFFSPSFFPTPSVAF